MFIVRILTGSHAGKTFQLKDGENTIGRVKGNDIVIGFSKISKKHASIFVENGRLRIIDHNSSNGTYINGTQIKSEYVSVNDKIAFSTIIVDVKQAYPQNVVPMPTNHQAYSNQNYNYQQHGNAAVNPQLGYHQPPHEETPKNSDFQQQEAASSEKSFKDDFKKFIHTYMEEVVLPGVYKLPELLEFKWVLGLFVVAFILLVSTLSTLPLVRILKASIETESQNRTATIARTLARENASSLQNRSYSGLSTETADSEPGVLQAYILDKNGSVLAPPSKANTYPEESEIHEAKKSEQSEIRQISDNKVLALEPIKIYDPHLGQQVVKGFAAVIYNMESLAANDERTISLYVQTFFISLVLGGILFFFMYKMIEHPILEINKQVDSALKEGGTNISTPYLFKALNDLTVNLTSAINRTNQSESSNVNDYSSSHYDRDFEMRNLIQIIGYDCVIISADKIITYANDSFWEKTGLNSMELIHQQVSAITDQSLKLNVESLMEKLDFDPSQIVSDELEFSGVKHQIAGQAVFGQEKIAYYIITIINMEEEAY